MLLRTASVMEMACYISAQQRRRWAITVSAFFVFLLTDGVRFSFGVLFVDLVHSFNSKKGDTAWIGAIIYSASNFAGTLASFTIKKIGCAWTIVVGAIMISVGILASSFAPSISVLYLTYGLLPGIGVCFMSLPVVVSITQNIEDGRSFAMGMALCGGGVGSFIFNPVFHSLLNLYGWRGTLMVVSGIMLNGIFLSLPNRRRHIQNSTKSDAQMSVSIANVQETDNLDVSKHKLGVYNCDDKESDKEAVAFMTLTDGQNNVETQQNMLQRCCEGHSVTLNTPEEDMTARNTSICVKMRGTLRKFANVILSIVPIHVFRNTHACVFIISAFVRSFAYFIPMAYLPDLVVEKGFSTSKASWAAAISGITQTVFRIVIGWLSDFRCIDRLILFNVCIIMSGAVSAICFLLSNYELLLMYAVVFGIFFSAETALVPVIAGDVSGPEGVGDTMGMLMTTCGFGALFGTPVAGWLFDKTGRYDLSYTAAGSVLALSGFIMFLLKILPSNAQQGMSISIDTEKEISYLEEETDDALK